MTVPNHTILPPAGRAADAVTTINGRAYSCAVGSAVSNVPDGDARELAANGWILSAPGGTGTTAARPTTGPDGVQAIRPNTLYLDTTLGYIVVWDGVTWRNTSTGAAA